MIFGMLANKIGKKNFWKDMENKPTWWPHKRKVPFMSPNHAARKYMHALVRRVSATMMYE